MIHLKRFMLVVVVTMACWSALADQGNFYVGPQAAYVWLDGDRDINNPDSELVDDAFYLGLGLGYRFNKDWAAEISYLTDTNSGMSVDFFNINGFRFFGDNFRPFVSAGFSHLDIDGVRDEDTDQVQLGLGIAKYLSAKWEARLWWQHMYNLAFGSDNDNVVTLALNYHFKRPAPPPPQSAPAPAPQPQAQAQPESVPSSEEVIETFELLVEFDTDKHSIRSVYQPQFDRIGGVLQQNPEINFIIEGHADWRHTEEYNQALSERRAQAVKEKFVRDYGIASSRIRTVGYGETRPIASNETDEGMQRNRRAIAVFTVKRRP